MQKAIMAVVAFIVIQTLITTMITGTSTGENLISDLGPLLAALGALVTFMGMSKMGSGRS